MRLWQEGKRAAAEKLCNEARARAPNDPQVLVVLAFMLSQTGRTPKAIDLLKRARTLAPGQASICFNLGVLLTEQGRLSEAEQSYRNALTLMPNSIEALTNLGQLLQQQGRLQEAVVLFRRSLDLRPHDGLALTNLGNALLELKDTGPAIVCLRGAVQAAPGAARAHFNLGNALRQADDLDGAIAALRQAVACDAGFCDAHYNLANALRDSGRIPEAIQAYRQALKLQPQHTLALNNLGAVLRASGLPGEALDCYQIILRLTPEEPMVHLNIGQALVDLHLEAAAVGYLARSVALNSASIDAILALGNAYRRLQRFDDAAAAYLSILAISPSHAAATAGLMLARMEQWDWIAVDALWERLRGNLDDQQPLPASVFLYFSNDPAEQLRGAKAAAARVLLEVPKDRREPNPSMPRAAAVSATGDSRIRVAYVSADFHDHPVGMSLVEVLELHDREKFRVIGVAIGPLREGALRSRIMGACDECLDLASQPTHAIAARLRALNLDIAIDLAGYTDTSRPAILAHRPAPIQVSYLGYSGTMGAAWIDYLMADACVIPEDLAEHYSEKILRLPHCFFPSDTLGLNVDAPPMTAVTRLQEGLPDDAVVLCCFNGLNRIPSLTMRVWAEILTAAANTVLWLKAPPNELAQRNLLEFMNQQGVAAGRIVFAKHAASRAQHLERHRLADLYLDSFPYNSHSTGRDALLTGLPLLTRSGNTFASRIAGSLLNTLGLAELIAHDDAEYRRKAVELARDHQSLARLRRHLRDSLRTSPLLDMRRLTRNMEAGYRRIVELRRAGQPAQHVSIID